MEDKTTQRSKIIAQEIRDWVETVNSTFHLRDLYGWIPELAKSRTDKQYIRKCLQRMIEKGVLKSNENYGVYRKIPTRAKRMDFLSVESKPVDLWLPFETDDTKSSLNDLIEIYPSNIIIIAGSKGVGKTTIAMNIAWHNRDTWDVNYFNSEMGKHELKKRIEMFKGTDPEEWYEKIFFYPEHSDFEEFIEIGPKKLNIIDYIESTGDDFPYVAKWIAAIHNKILNTETICILCLQKPPGRDEAYGGTQTRNKPRLYLSVSRGKMLILDSKNWRSQENPQYRACDFKIVGGSKLLQTSSWDKTNKWNS